MSFNRTETQVSFLNSLQGTFPIKDIFHIAKNKETSVVFQSSLSNNPSLRNKQIKTIYEQQSPFENLNEYLIEQKKLDSNENLYLIFVSSESIILDGLPFLQSIFTDSGDKFIIYSQDSINTPLSPLLEPYLEVAHVNDYFQLLSNFQTFNDVPLADIFNQIILNLEKNALFYAEEVYTPKYKNSITLKVLSLEQCYYKVLNQAFDKDSLEVLNNNYDDVSALKNTSPEYGVGKFLHIKKRKELLLQRLIQSENHDLITEYVTLIKSGIYGQKKISAINAVATKLFDYLKSINSPIIKEFFSLNDYLVKSYWLITY